MTDTETPFFDVDYELIVLEELPAQERSSNHGGASSILEEQIKAIKGDTSKHNKWVRIGTYGRKTAGPAARNVLRLRYGKSPAVAGFQFECRSVNVDGAKRTGLFVKYDPTGIIAGAEEAHGVWLAEREVQLATKRAEREKQAAADKAKAEREAARAAAKEAPRQP